MSDAILSVDGLGYSYKKDAPVLKNVSFDLEEGTLLSVLGPNGVGKSTMFRCILGSLESYSGVISSRGTDLRGLGLRGRSELMAYIPQISKPSFQYSVLDVTLMGTARLMPHMSSPGRDEERRAMEALTRVGADHLSERGYASLSGGEQQLVLIARALAQDARILVMDEPTSALDYGNQFRVLQLVKSLAREGRSILLSTHNPQHAIMFSDSVLALADGEVAAFGRTGEVLTPELLGKLYGIPVIFADSPAGPVPVPVPETLTH